MERAAGAVLPDAPPGQETGVTVSWEEICRYLDSLAVRGRQRETIQVYRPKLEAFFRFLPRDRLVTARTLEDWRLSLLKAGYSPGTVNTHISAANGLLAFLGRRDLQLIGQLDTGEEIQPELTRAEYLRLLTTARTLCRDARVDAEKSNPRCLRRLYQATQEQIRADVLSLAEQAHEQLLDTEQRTVGWENGG